MQHKLKRIPSNIILNIPEVLSINNDDVNVDIVVEDYIPSPEIKEGKGIQWLRIHLIAYLGFLSFKFLKKKDMCSKIIGGVFLFLVFISGFTFLSLKALNVWNNFN